MKRISYWVLSTVSAIVLLFGFDASQRGATSASTATISGGTSGTKSGSGASSHSSGNSSGNNSGNNSGNSSGNSSGSTSPSTQTVTGSVAQTQWGPVQVQLAVRNGSITKVNILQYPNGNGRDLEIANYSLPILIQETIQSQSANIDMVSGATYTSSGYIQSLQSALDQANL